MTALPETKGLSKSFSVKEKSFEALRDVNLSVGEKEFICILAPSGCGKTTLLRIMAGLERVSDGPVLLDRVPIEGKGPQRGWYFRSTPSFPGGRSSTT